MMYKIYAGNNPVLILAADELVKYGKGSFEKRIRLRTRLRWTGRKQKYTEADVSAFSREKKFFSFPRLPSAFIRK